MRTSLAQPDSCDAPQFGAALFWSFGHCAPPHARLPVLGSKQPMSQLSSTRTSRLDRFGEFSRYSRPLNLILLLLRSSFLTFASDGAFVNHLTSSVVTFVLTRLSSCSTAHLYDVRNILINEIVKFWSRIRMTRIQSHDSFAYSSHLLLCELDAVAALVLDGVVAVRLDDVVAVEVVLEVFVAVVV